MSDHVHPSYELDKSNILQRLRKIEGQVRGIQGMINDDRYCIDILTQVAAVQAALDKVGLMILEDHTRGCVTRAIREDGGSEAIEELISVIGKFIR